MFTGLLLTIAFGGLVLERILSRHKSKSHKFTWFHYSIFLSYPVAITALLVYALDARLLLVFVAAAIFGAAAEWSMGYFYNDIVGQKLWVYKKYSIGTYTSWLALPLWGVAGVLFAVLTSSLLR